MFVVEVLDYEIGAGSSVMEFTSLRPVRASASTDPGMLVIEAGYDVGISNLERQNLAGPSQGLIDRGMFVVEEIS